VLHTSLTVVTIALLYATPPDSPMLLVPMASAASAAIVAIPRAIVTCAESGMFLVLWPCFFAGGFSGHRSSVENRRSAVGRDL